ncbi:MAG: ABC transporter permease, partial [Verrucomicrobiales bacterium]|nr:ABC transporter permease [Verrucomicrobiales bacterium]
MPSQAQIASVTTANGTATLACSGAWSISSHPDFAPVSAQLGNPQKLAFDLSAVETWDSSLVIFVLDTIKIAEQTRAEIDFDSLPDNIRQLVELSRAVPEEDTKRGTKKTINPITALGQATIDATTAFSHSLEFIGQTVLAFLSLTTRKTFFRGRDFALLLHQCGGGALPIVGLIATLTGLILAFVGAIQLQQFGAELYVADLVGIAMSREMGALMTGIIMAGRSGAAFAAHIGSMKANEEIDALTTLGIDPFGYLVTPRIIALAVMLPLLSLYAVLLGLLGGMAISVTMLDIQPTQYWLETRTVVDLTQLTIGIVKALAFGLIIAFCGCYHGMRSGTDAAAVGRATTSAVVSSIVFIVIADSLSAV